MNVRRRGLEFHAGPMLQRVGAIETLLVLALVVTSDRDGTWSVQLTIFNFSLFLGWVDKDTRP